MSKLRHTLQLLHGGVLSTRQIGAALGISPPAIAELLPALEAVMVRRVNEQIAASRD